MAWESPPPTPPPGSFASPQIPPASRCRRPPPENCAALGSPTSALGLAPIRQLLLESFSAGLQRRLQSRHSSCNRCDLNPRSCPTGEERRPTPLPSPSDAHRRYLAVVPQSCSSPCPFLLPNLHHPILHSLHQNFAAPCLPNHQIRQVAPIRSVYRLVPIRRRCSPPNPVLQDILAAFQHIGSHSQNIPFHCEMISGLMIGTTPAIFRESKNYLQIGRVICSPANFRWGVGRWGTKRQSRRISRKGIDPVIERWSARIPLRTVSENLSKRSHEHSKQITHQNC